MLESKRNELKKRRDELLDLINDPFMSQGMKKVFLMEVYRIDNLQCLAICEMYHS